jgi:hypothetical protein
MPSSAQKRFDENADDVARLLEIHSDLGGSKVGRRHRLEVLNKSAIVLITAFWEAYCEDLAAEALDHIVGKAPNAGALPKELKKQIASELKAAPNEIAVWNLADAQWRTVLKARLANLAAQRNRKLNTPKSENIDQLFESAIGLNAVSDSWKWGKLSPAKSRTKLDKYVTLRGEVAHRGSAATSCKKKDVLSFFSHVQRLVSKTAGRVDGHVKAVTGTALW